MDPIQSKHWIGWIDPIQATVAGRRRKGVSRRKARSTTSRPKASSLANRLYSCKTGLSTDNKINVICYTFAFNIATATASSLGLVSSIAVIIITVNFVLLKCSHGQDKTPCRAVCTVGIQAIVFLIILGSTYFLFYYRFISTKQDKISEIIEFQQALH